MFAVLLKVMVTFCTAVCEPRLNVNQRTVPNVTAGKLL